MSSTRPVHDNGVDVDPKLVFDLSGGAHERAPVRIADDEDVDISREVLAEAS